MTTMRLVLAPAFTLALAAAASVAQSAPVYRCGQTYSQTPCPGGHVVEATDPRTAAQRAEAKRVAEREKKMAAQLEHDRIARERGEPNAQASGFDSRAPAASAAKPAQAKKKKGAKAASGADVIVIEPRPGKAAPK